MSMDFNLLYKNLTVKYYQRDSFPEVRKNLKSFKTIINTTNLSEEEKVAEILNFCKDISEKIAFEFHKIKNHGLFRYECPDELRTKHYFMLGIMEYLMPFYSFKVTEVLMEITKEVEGVYFEDAFDMLFDIEKEKMKGYLIRIAKKTEDYDVKRKTCYILKINFKYEC